MKNKKVAILGKLQTKFYAPFWSKDWDIWTLNNNEGVLPRIDLWFDVHTPDGSTIPYYKANITQKNFPFQAVQRLVGGSYFNNSISYMIAYAILLNYKEIALYGMRFTLDSEHRRQEYFNVRELIFFAKGKGIKVTAPYDDVMLQEYPLYGIESN